MDRAESVHGEAKVESEVSGYYLALEISRMYAGMMVAIPEEHWQVFQRCSRKEMVRLLRKLAKGMCLARYRKQRRSPKKPALERTYDKGQPHGGDRTVVRETETTVKQAVILHREWAGCKAHRAQVGRYDSSPPSPRQHPLETYCCGSHRSQLGRPR